MFTQKTIKRPTIGKSASKSLLIKATQRFYDELFIVGAIFRLYKSP